MADIWDKERRRGERAETVRAEWNFFWDTSLTNPQMDEICAWLATLTPQQKMYIQKLRDDAISDWHFDHCGEDA